MRGRVIAGKYELQRELGRGGMGVVWVALDRTLHREVALKLMSPQYLQNEEARQRFEREAKVLAKIQNEHIVAVYEYGVFEDAPYIVMELLHGEDLEARLRRQIRLSPQEILAIVRQVCRALTAAASMGVVHRDLKPSNIFLVCDAAGETVKILDFGVAWMWTDSLDISSPGRILGTPAYMSPEQLHNHPVHHATDLWALAVIAYRALTGELPFRGSSIPEFVLSICTDHSKPPSSIASELAPALDGFFEVALAKYQEARFQSAREFAASFERHAATYDAINVLVVDDEVSVHDLMKMRYRKELEAGSHRMYFASNGAEALDELSRNDAIDVVLADINMPEMDGLTLLRHIPEVSPFAKTVMVTAYDDMSNIRRAMNHGAFDFLVKPIRFADLDATIKKTASLARERRMLASSDVQNRMLRKLANSLVVARLHDHEPSVALASERCQATVVHVAIAEPVSVTPTVPPHDVARTINAIFEVVIPELVANGGNIDTVLGSGLLAVFDGQDHVIWALRGCTRLNAKIASLARLVGDDSPYARGLKIGVSSGDLVLACLGSHTSGRLSYTVAGEAVEQARRLSSLAQPKEILACSISLDTSIVEFQFESVAERREPRFVDGPLLRVLSLEEPGPVTTSDSTLTISKITGQFSDQRSGADGGGAKEDITEAGGR